MMRVADTFRDYGQRLLLAALLFALSLFIYTFKADYLGVNDTVPNVLLPVSVIYELDFDYDEFVQNNEPLPYWFTERGGRIVSVYPIVPGLLSVPLFALAHSLGADIFSSRYTLSLFSAAIISSLSVSFIYLTLCRVCRREGSALLCAVVYALATCVWSVASRGVWQHGPSLMFISIVLLLMVRGEERASAWSGFFMGMAIWCRPGNAVVLIPLALYILLYRKRRRAQFILLSLLPLALMSLYSYRYLGSVRALGKAHVISFSGNFLAGFLGLLFSPSRGLFIYSPVLLFAFGYMLVLFFSRGTAAFYRFLAVSVIALVLLYSKWFMWWGGHCYGYRIILEVVPLLMVFLALCWEDILSKSRALTVIFCVLLAFSVYVQLLGAYMYASGFNREPNDIDHHVERLWSVRDTQVGRCTAKLFEKVRSYSPR